MDARPFGIHLERGRCRLGRIQNRERIINPVGDAHSGRKADLCAALIGRFAGEGESGIVGARRFFNPPQVVEQSPAVKGQAEADLPGSGNLAAFLDQPERLFQPVGRACHGGCVEEGSCRPLVVGAGEMLGIQAWVAATVPIGGPPVQRLAPGFRQGGIDGFMNQRVGECHVLAGRAHQPLFHQGVYRRRGLL